MSEAACAIRRHLTAMTRRALSQPMGLLLRHGVLASDDSVFDYGCGQGDDVRSLVDAGFDAHGWDPHFAPSDPLVPSDVVNLGFVLNVIEDGDERKEALSGAWSLALKVLSVATMTAGQVATDGLTPFRDGYRTSRGTFQKYFSQVELRSLISDTLPADPVAVAPGIFFVFRHEEDRQDFLIRRRSSRRSLAERHLIPGSRGAVPPSGEDLAEAYDECEDFMRVRGRVPHADELSADVAAKLRRCRMSVTRMAETCLRDRLSAEEMLGAADAMREDLMVHFALASLQAGRGVEKLSLGLQRDVKAHFGSRRALDEASRGYLLGLADEQAVRRMMDLAADAGVGVLDDRRRLVLVGAKRGSLPAMLKVYLGCAELLAGEPPEGALVRVDPGRRRVDYLGIDDEGPPLPTVSSQTIVDLRRLAVHETTTRRILVAASRLIEGRSGEQLEQEARHRADLRLPDACLLLRAE